MCVLYNFDLRSVLNLYNHSLILMKVLLYNDKLLHHTCKEATSKECEGIYLITIKPFQDMSTSCVLLRNYLSLLSNKKIIYLTYRYLKPHFRINDLSKLKKLSLSLNSVNCRIESSYIVYRLILSFMLCLKQVCQNQQQPPGKTLNSSSFSNIDK